MCPAAYQHYLERQRTKRASDPMWAERRRGHSRESMSKWRAQARKVGLCTHCCVREAEFGASICIRCSRYQAERYYLGYSTIPLAKGSEG